MRWLRVLYMLPMIPRACSLKGTVPKPANPAQHHHCKPMLLRSDPRFAFPEGGMTPVHLACLKMQAPVVEELVLIYDVDVNLETGLLLRGEKGQGKGGQ